MSPHERQSWLCRLARRRGEQPRFKPRRAIGGPYRFRRHRSGAVLEAVDPDADPWETRAHEARIRAEQAQTRALELSRGMVMGRQDIDAAAERARVARVRVADAQDRSADAHDKTAARLEGLSARGGPDSETHLAAASRHRHAAAADRAAAAITRANAPEQPPPATSSESA